MTIFLWVLQILLAAAFLMAGLQKATKQRAELASRMAWVEDFSDTTVRVIGVLEILAAIGLILPAATGVAPILTPLAALGIVLLMISAAITHVRRREPQVIVINAVLLAMAAVVVWGRLGPYSS